MRAVTPAPEPETEITTDSHLYLDLEGDCIAELDVNKESIELYCPLDGDCSEEAEQHALSAIFDSVAAELSSAHRRHVSRLSLRVMDCTLHPTTTHGPLHRSIKELARCIEHHPSLCHITLAGLPQCVFASSTNLLASLHSVQTLEINSGAEPTFHDIEGPQYAYDAKFFQHILAHSPSLRELDLSNASFGETSLSHFSDSLQRHHGIEKIILSHIAFNACPSATNEFAATLSSHASIQDITFSDIDASNTCFFQEFARGLAANEKLDSLTLEEINVHNPLSLLQILKALATICTISTLAITERQKGLPKDVLKCIGQANIRFLKLKGYLAEADDASAFDVNGRKHSDYDELCPLLAAADSTCAQEAKASIMKAIGPSKTIEYIEMGCPPVVVSMPR